MQVKHPYTWKCVGERERNGYKKLGKMLYTCNPSSTQEAEAGESKHLIDSADFFKKWFWLRSYSDIVLLALYFLYTVHREHLSVGFSQSREVSLQPPHKSPCPGFCSSEDQRHPVSTELHPSPYSMYLLGFLQGPSRVLVLCCHTFISVSLYKCSSLLSVYSYLEVTLAWPSTSRSMNGRCCHSSGH